MTSSEDDKMGAVLRSKISDFGTTKGDTIKNNKKRNSDYMESGGEGVFKFKNPYFRLY